MAILLETDPVCFARDENNDIIIPLRVARGLEAVLILVRTAWRLWRDEWFLNRDAGTPWIETEDGVVTETEAILGQPYDAAKIARVLRAEALAAHPAVTDVAEFKSSFDPEERSMSVTAVIRSRFGDAPVSVVLPA
jgi:hypothetical protein